MKTWIRHGTLGAADGCRQGDLLLDGEQIVAAGDIGTPNADREVDATGLLVLPGGVDVHTHLDMPVGNIRTADDFESGTIAAACGGTTTVIDYASQTAGRSLHAGLEDWTARAAGRAVVDFGFHMTICDLHPEIEHEIADLVELGVPSFKVFMAYPGRMMLDDGQIFRVLERAARAGALVCLHAENGPVIDVLVREALRRGQSGPPFHAVTRPPELEAEAIHRGIVLSSLAGAELYVVHLSSALGLEEIRAARQRHLRVHAETCPQYLCLDEEAYAPGGLDAAKFVMSPPLRHHASNHALWDGLVKGDVDVVATDHCPFTLEAKASGLSDFSVIPNGAPGIETRMQLVYDGGVCSGTLPLERFVEVTATAPARLFGLYPRKGTLLPGADADVVLFDPNAVSTLSAGSQHMRVDYNPYEGRQVRGAIEAVWSRGTLIAEGGRFIGPRGHGRFLARQARNRG